MSTKIRAGCIFHDDCILDAGHERACRDGNGDLIPMGTRYDTDQARSFRSSPGREIRGSIATEFEDDGGKLLAVIEAAEALEPYLTYYLWNEKRHELRSSPNPSAFFLACLANHGIEIYS